MLWASNPVKLMHFQRDCNRIYDQEFLTADFVHLYYNRYTVGVDEPGVISYFSEGRKFDFTGIASYDVARCKSRREWSPMFADSLSRKAGISTAIVSEPFFNMAPWPKWNKIASWQIPGRTIDFYTVNQYDSTKLRKSLREYQLRLPSDVTVRYY
jgi:hypothetical protein